MISEVMRRCFVSRPNDDYAPAGRNYDILFADINADDFSPYFRGVFKRLLMTGRYYAFSRFAPSR